jgi:hypothetical protein
MKYNFIILAALMLLLGSCQKKEEKTETETNQNTKTEPSGTGLSENTEMCFMQVVSKDTLLLTVIKKGNDVSGTYKSAPYEKDKKTNVFSGTLSGNTITAVGTALGEGSAVQDEIIITLVDNQAGIKFGEMSEGDDGVYRYKNIKSATSLFIKRVDCLK